MPLLTYIRKYFWRIFLRAVFYSGCVVLIYLLYHWSPRPIQAIKIVPHDLSLPRLPLASTVEENYYQVFINGVDTKQITLFFKDKQGRLWVAAKDLEGWRLNKPVVLPITYNNQPFYSLSQYPGLTYTVDKENLVIKLQIPVGFFKVNYIDVGASKINTFVLPSPGLFFNYNLLDTKNAGPQPNNQFTGLFELGLFNSYGTGSMFFVNQNTPNTETWLRLTTTWRHDEPDHMWTLSVGDDVSASTNWTSSVNFGGVQWGTNFSTQPQFITFPQMGFKGQATVPSTLDLYINNSLVTQQQIPSGAYDISNIPYIDGYGNMHVVTTDILGRKSSVSIPFYASNLLLKTGLKNYTYEFGLIRQNLGISSFDYARFLGAATESIGLNDTFTLQWHLEGLSDQQTVGLAVFKQLWNLGVLNGSLGVSHINAGNKDGGLLLAGFQRLTPTYSLSVSSQITTLYFTQEGIEPGTFSPRLINIASAGTAILGTSVSCNYVREINRDEPGNDLIIMTLSRNIFFDIALSVSGQTNLSGTRNKGVFLTLTRSLGTDTSGAILNSIENDVHQESVQVIRSLPQGPGYGYNFIGTTGSSENNKLASVSYQNDIGTYQGGVTQNNGITSYSLNIQGAAVYLGGQSYLMRNLNGNSFAVVQTPGFSNVDVYVNNQLSAVSDKNGNALIPDLLPYQETPIRIDPNTLPLNANIGETSVTVAPYYSSGIIVPFAVKSIRGVILTVKQSSGEFVPEGSVVTVPKQTEEYVVGSNGQTYLTNLDPTDRVDVNWEGHHCQFVLTLPPLDPKNPVPDLGTFICNEVKNEQTKKSVP